MTLLVCASMMRSAFDVNLEPLQFCPIPVLCRRKEVGSCKTKDAPPGKPNIVVKPA